MRAAAGGDRRRSQSLRRDRHDCRHPCGAILLAEIDNGIALANVAWLYQNMIVGAILVVAVAADLLPPAAPLCAASDAGPAI